MQSPQPELAELVGVARSLFHRGYSFGTAGNLSVRVDDLVYAMPTGSSFETLEPEQIACCAIDGTVLTAASPTKELPFHLAAYRARPYARAVVHLHSTYATAVACLRDLNLENDSCAHGIFWYESSRFACRTLSAPRRFRPGR